VSSAVDAIGGEARARPIEKGVWGALKAQEGARNGLVKALVTGLASRGSTLCCAEGAGGAQGAIVFQGAETARKGPAGARQTLRRGWATVAARLTRHTGQSQAHNHAVRAMFAGLTIQGGHRCLVGARRAQRAYCHLRDGRETASSALQARRHAHAAVVGARGARCAVQQTDEAVSGGVGAGGARHYADATATVGADGAHHARARHAIAALHVGERVGRARIAAVNTVTNTKGGDGAGHTLGCHRVQKCGGPAVQRRTPR